MSSARAFRGPAEMTRCNRCDDCMAESNTMGGEHLYVMALSIDPTGEVYGLRVGSSDEIERLVDAMSESKPFHINVLATFPCAGWAATRVHSALGASRGLNEWFHVPLPRVLHTIACVMDGVM